MNKKSSGIAIAGGIAAVVIAVVVVTFMFSGMSNEQEPMNNLVDDVNENNVTLQEDDKIIVYASFFPYYEFAKNVAGDKAIVIHIWFHPKSGVHKGISVLKRLDFSCSWFPIVCFYSRWKILFNYCFVPCNILCIAILRQF